MISTSHRFLRAGHFEPPLDKQAGENSRRGPPVAHSLPVYKTAHKLQSSARWKTANVITNVVGGKDYRLRETHGEGRVDDTGMYRDWLYGEERRFANYSAIALGCTSISLFYYTMKMMGQETWDIPAPLLTKPPDVASRNTAPKTPLPPIVTRSNLVKKDELAAARQKEEDAEVAGAAVRAGKA